ncbi:MAG: Uma2 family endonuclease [Phormidesmis sp.]
MAPLDQPSTIALEPAKLKRWTVETYNRMSELGILASHERTELIMGQIVVMAAKGTPHITALRLLAQQLDQFLADRPFFASTQDPIALDDLSELEPDLAILRGEILDYNNKHPQPQDVVLITEIADSTLRQDCEVKDKVYARANIPEYWVLDLKNYQLHIFQQPTADGYGSHLILSTAGNVSPLAFPEMAIAISFIFPPR